MTDHFDKSPLKSLFVLVFAILLAESHAVVEDAPWQGNNMKMTHYWDCNGQGCDATTLQPWMESRYISPPGYGPQDPKDFGGPVYGEKMWLTGAASDALSKLMGDDDGCCGGDPNDGGVGGCGKCVLVQNPLSLHPDWTVVVMKKTDAPLIRMVVALASRTSTSRRLVLTTCNTPQQMFAAADQTQGLSANNRAPYWGGGTQSAKILPSVRTYVTSCHRRSRKAASSSLPGGGSVATRAL